MKLYSIFEEVILEEVNKHNLITESVSNDAVNDAINNKYNVNILYRDYDDQPPSKRYIQVYNFAKTKGNVTGGNDAIRAYQIMGGSKTTPNEGAWKIFRLDRIEGWFPTKVKFAQPVSQLDPTIPKYNQNGDRSMAKVYNKVNFLNK